MNSSCNFGWLFSESSRDLSISGYPVMELHKGLSLYTQLFGLHVHLCADHVYRDCGSQRRALEPTALELQMVESCHVGTGNNQYS